MLKFPPLIEIKQQKQLRSIFRWSVARPGTGQKQQKALILP